VCVCVGGGGVNLQRVGRGSSLAGSTLILVVPCGDGQ
jgi:hypothetical protein